MHKKVSEILLEKDNWLFILPIYGLELTKEVNSEIKIDSVTFISVEKLKRVRKKFLIPNKISELRTTFFKNENIKTVALIRQNGEIEDIRISLYKRVQDELNILISSFTGFNNRNFFHKVDYLDNNENSKVSEIFISTRRESRYTDQDKFINIIPLLTCSFWKRYQKKNHYFFDLLKIIKSKKSKFKELKKVSIVIGKSYNCNDIVDSFLYNMIIMETLLTTRNDKQKETLVSRLGAFFEWLQGWDESVENQIDELYKKRSAYVHNLDSDNITIQDVLFTDTLIFNLMNNIVKHPKLFSSKNDLIEFSKKIEAEKVLGIKSKIRPKTFYFLEKRYKEEDYKYL